MNHIDSKQTDFETVSKIIRQRRTLKVLAPIDAPLPIDQQAEPGNRQLVRDAVANAGWAPFHYDRSVDGIAEPWRAHLLWHPACRQVASHFDSWFDDIKPGNKLPAMLSACGALVLVTWLPQFASASEYDNNSQRAGEGSQRADQQKQRLVDEEHLAAAAAMVQNLLLLLTAAGMGTYWSSGGQFQSTAMFERLGIPANEKLLAAVFVEFPESQSLSTERLAGKQRSKRSPAEKWCREIEL